MLRSEDREDRVRRHLLHHPSPELRHDANDTLWTSSGGGGGVVGWVNTKMLDETDDAAKSQGWTALVLDTNGNGKRDEYTEPNQPLDPSKDRRVAQVFYAVMLSPMDGSVWGTIRSNPGAIVRIDPGSNPPETALSEIYNVPLPGFGPRGGDIDSKGVSGCRSAAATWARSTARKCKGPLNGPKATGDHCPEGWTFYKYPGPGFEGIGENSAESSYYSWVDQHNTFGLGDDVPMSTANLTDGLVALQGRQDDLDARAVPDGLLRQGARRPHRRSERRLEGPRPVGLQRRSRAVADRRRQGHQADGRALPGPPRSARALNVVAHDC